MKRSVFFILVFIIAALSVTCVSASPRNFDQMGNKYWCFVDKDGCWITGENGVREYIMFWSEAAREKFMGPDSKAPIGINPGTPELNLLPPKEIKEAIDYCKGYKQCTQYIGKTEDDAFEWISDCEGEARFITETIVLCIMDEFDNG